VREETNGRRKKEKETVKNVKQGRKNKNMKSRKRKNEKIKRENWRYIKNG
jgi:hypothetical protein